MTANIQTGDVHLNALVDQLMLMESSVSVPAVAAAVAALVYEIKIRTAEMEELRRELEEVKSGPFRPLLAREGGNE